MNKPDIRIIQSQEETNNEVNINSWEAEQLLRKYGHKPEYSTIQQPPQQIDNGLSFEEMVAKQEEIERLERNRQTQKYNSPSPITFNSNNGYSSEVRYAADDDTGFGFKIEVSTDMILPR